MTTLEWAVTIVLAAWVVTVAVMVREVYLDARRPLDRLAAHGQRTRYDRQCDQPGCYCHDPRYEATP